MKKFIFNLTGLLRNWAKMKPPFRRYRVALFFVLVLIIGWFPWYMGTGSIIWFAPTLAGLAMAFLGDGKRGLMEFLRSAVRWRARVSLYALALLFPGVAAMAAIGIHVLSGGALPNAPLFRLDLHVIMILFVAFFSPLASAAGEEFGFRGYGLPKLQNRFGPFFGTLILGTFFGAWVLPEFFREGSAQYMMGGMNYYVFYILTEIGFSVFMTFIYNRTDGSSLICGYMMHAAMNFWVGALMIDISSDFAFKPFDIRLFHINTAVVLLAALLLLIVTKGRLGLKRVEG